VIRPDEIFTNIRGNRAYCPLCDDGKKRKQGTVEINADYAFCHKCEEDFQFNKAFIKIPKKEYKLENTKPVEPLKILEESDYNQSRINFVNNYKKLFKELKLPWNDVALENRFGLGVFRNPERHLQLVFKINDEHIKHHKGKQFGSAKCKIYPSPTYPKSCTLLLCEGEKDAITANCHGASAITFTSGAGALPSDLTMIDKYNNIIIAYDNDEKGREGAKKVAKALWNKERSVSIVKWRGVQDQWDVTDHFASGTLDELVAMAEPFGKDPTELGGMPVFSPDQFAEEFKDPPVPIVEGLLYEKDILGVAGSTNVGKSVFSLQLSTSIAMGVPFLNFKIPKPKRVMHVQFELKDESFSNLLRVTSGTIKEKYPVEAPLFNENCFILSSGQMDLFTDKYAQIEANLRHTNVDVLVIDNLYTSVGVDVSRNEFLMDVLRKLMNLKQKYGVAIVLVCHHKKMDLPVPLDVSQILGGSSLTNSLDFICQIASTKRAEGVKVLKVTKVRAHSKFHGIPLALKLNNFLDEHDKQTLMFEYLRPLPKNEMFWYSDPKESNEERVLKAIECEGDNFSWESFKIALENVMKLTSNKAVYNWIDKMIAQGLIEKIERGHYRKLSSEIDDIFEN
tara:strand:+ start:123 stop:1988 length:1866 start_codon:yes stop_codon:yes gene_type:complete